MNKNLVPLSLAVLAGAAASAMAQTTGPSTLQSPYFVPAIPSMQIVVYSIASNGNGSLTPAETFTRLNGAAPYRFVGIPDGAGAFRSAQDLIDGTFTLVLNHELGNNQGIARDHGSRGAFVSMWKIRTNPGSANHLEVLGGQDLIQTVKLFRRSTSAYETYNAASPMPTYNGTLGTGPDPSLNGWARFCSADMALPSAYKFGALGTDDRILLNGEENGATGRAFAHVATGPETGTTYELPRFGNYSWENSVACPFAQEKTLVMGLDDSTPGNVYLYAGAKQASGNAIERAGLSNGIKYGLVIQGVTVTAGQPTEDRVNGLGTAATGPIFTKPFTMYNFGDVTNVSGAQLQSIGDANGVINWLRPEDGAWDPQDPSAFYFVTTDSFTGNSRVWLLDFTDITQPELGGIATMLADGSNPASLAGGIISGTGISDIRMMDNFCTTHNGQLVIQEDVGNNPRLGRIWLYDLARDSMTEILQADPNRFLMGSGALITQDEEGSGVIDAWDIIGPGWFLFDMQAHYSISGELAEGGQLMAMYIPQTIPGPASCYANCDASTTPPVLNVNDFQCFLNLFASNDPLANCDGSIAPPILNVNDFACFVNAAAAGCN